jgi:hypothetical protein
MLISLLRPQAKDIGQEKDLSLRLKPHEVMLPVNDVDQCEALSQAHQFASVR